LCCISLPALKLSEYAKSIAVIIVMPIGLSVVPILSTLKDEIAKFLRELSSPGVPGPVTGGSPVSFPVSPVSFPVSPVSFPVPPVSFPKPVSVGVEGCSGRLSQKPRT
jgi:hypothetical protein